MDPGHWGEIYIGSSAEDTVPLSEGADPVVPDCFSIMAEVFANKCGYKEAGRKEASFSASRVSRRGWKKSGYDANVSMVQWCECCY